MYACIGASLHAACSATRAAEPAREATAAIDYMAKAARCASTVLQMEAEEVRLLRSPLPFIPADVPYPPTLLIWRSFTTSSRPLPISSFALASLSLMLLSPPRPAFRA
jgi:hypothetical protein